MKIFTSYLFHPRLMIENLKLQQNSSDLVIVPDDPFAIVTLQDLWVFLQMFHWFLNPSEHLSSPHDLAGNRREIPSDGRLVTKSLIGLLDVLDISAKLKKYLVVFVGNGFF